VLLLLVELGRRVEVIGLVVDDDPREPPGRQIAEELAELSLAVDHEGREQEEFGARRQLRKLSRHVLGAPRLHDLSAEMAVLFAQLGVEHAQVVVDLRDGAHGRTRVSRSALLLDGDGR
jgi:hypothetical protein